MDSLYSEVVTVMKAATLLFQASTVAILLMSVLSPDILFVAFWYYLIIFGMILIASIKQ